MQLTGGLQSWVGGGRGGRATGAAGRREGMRSAAMVVNGLAVDGGFHHVGYHATGLVSHFASAVTAVLYAWRLAKGDG